MIISKRRALIASIMAIVLVHTQGCALLAVGAAGAITAKVANDRRTVGTQLDDQTAEGQVAYRWSKNESLKKSANLQIDIYNGVALVTGQAPSQVLIDEAIAAVKSVEYVQKVHNQIRIGMPIDASAQAKDIWLASKVKTKLVADERIPSLQVKVIVQNSEVFLMGRVTNQEGTYAVDVARNINGVTRVIRAFEIM
ncbi:BON domain-containing protein [Aestuariibacter sp. A3R04]|uniref:BON domain-containing protein n=1 Tax=Aestuariibacter sp. A3R04 TaxID=2841571 RepID=UPI001C08E695|nr:BON domain-containing protein [Aestuariibacter sp. A3R04]MBU3021457.1 BON domain-containing protein [Aestuariibacter sp. A3R04]